MNFGSCKGDVSGFNLKSCFRSKGGRLEASCGRERKVVMVGRNLIYGIAGVEKCILKLEMNHHQLHQPRTALKILSKTTQK